MTSFPDLLQQGTAQAWLFIPTAILLGALHGLEPGHSKTMMAAFIIAVRGTLRQALMLGLAATLSHTIVVWGVVLTGMYLWRDMDMAGTEAYFQLASAVAIIGIALWMLVRIWRDNHPSHHEHGGHGHGHEHGHEHSHHHTAKDDVLDTEHMDAHERAHALDIQHRFAGRKDVTTGQILMFGLTGGLIPCPAAITVLLFCLQFKQITLGATLVFCFSIGLAITLMTVGAAAAIGVRHASKNYSWFGTIARKAPYFSSILILLVGVYMAFHGVSGLLKP
jgi:nickel/cobalt transporter (NicO) family protein